MNAKDVSSIYNKLFKFVLLFLVIFIPYRELFSHFITSSVKVIPDIMILFLFVLYVIKTNFRIRLNSTDIFYAVFLIIAFVSTVIINHVGIKSYIVQTRSIFIYYILYFMLRNTRLNDDFYKLFSKVLVYNTVILVTLSLVEKVTSKEFLFPTGWAQSIFYADNFLRVYGMFNNPNTFGAYLLFSVIIIIYLEKQLYIKTKGFFYLFCISGIILTASRSSMISLGIVIVASTLLFEKKEMIKKFAINIAAAILIVFCINNLSGFYVNNIAKNNIGIETGKGSTNSAVNRLEELSNPAIISKSKTDGRIFSIMKGIEIFKNNPIIGTGFGSYGDAASLIITPKQYNKYEISEGFYADNEYIKVLVETGVVGAIAYALFLISILINYRKSTFKLMSCLVLGFLGMFYNIFEVQILSYLFWITLTLPEKSNSFRLYRG